MEARNWSRTLSSSLTFSWQSRANSVTSPGGGGVTWIAGCGCNVVGMEGLLYFM